MGPTPNNLLARFTAAKVPPQHPLQLRRSVVTLQRFGRVTDRMGAKGKRGILTKISPETTTSLQAGDTTK